MLREATLDVIDQIGTPAEPFDAELLPGLIDGLVDGGTVLDGAMQLVGEATGHSDAPDLGPDAVDLGIPEAEEADVVKALAGYIFQNLQRRRAGDLEQVVVQPLDLDIGRHRDVLIGAGRTPRERFEVVVALAL